MSINLASADAVYEDLHRRIRRDLLWRLRWNVLDAVEDIEISAGPYDQAVIVPFLSHPLADEPVFDPPLSFIDEINIGDFGAKEDRDIYYPEEERYQGPASLKIVNENGSAITMRQFVMEVHAYVGRNMEELKKVKGEMYGELVTDANGNQMRVIVFERPVTLPDNIGIFFNKVWATNRDGRVCVTVKLYAEGEVSYPDGFWAHRLLQSRLEEARR